MSGTTEFGAPVNRILLECTDTYFTDWNSGIQQVVRNVAAESRAISDELGIECKTIVRHGGRYLAVPWRPLINRTPSWWTKVFRALWPGKEFWDRNAALRFTRWLGIRLRKSLYPRSLVRRLKYSPWLHKGRTIVPGAGDTLVLLDAWWNRSIWHSVIEARDRGARIGIVMYDLLPVTNPEFFKANVKDPFQASLEKALEYGDYFIAISNAVRDTLRDHASQASTSCKHDDSAFMSFRLGSTLDMAGQQGPVREAVKTAFGKDKSRAPYLAVGTIEPRKNHVLLVDAFDKIWRRHSDARLCLVGRVGWLCEDLIARIIGHPQYNRSLFMFNDLTDVELDFCYQHAKAFVFPSHAEGFGLPVVEALQHGLRVMVSDIPIHREVGRDFCTYFDHADPEPLARLLSTFETTGTLPATRTPGQFSLPDWADSTRDFLAKCLAACRHQGRPDQHQSRAA